MKKFFLILLITSASFIGCARAKVDVGGTDKPIKVDVTMRVDVYQHVVKEIDDIESTIRSGKYEKPQETDRKEDRPQSLLSFFVKDAWAAELSPEGQVAVQSRKERLDKVNELLSNGIVGEDNQGFLEIRKSGDPDAEAVTFSENADRKEIYEDLAAQNNVTPEAIAEIYAEKMQNLAPAGSPIQGKGESWATK